MAHCALLTQSINAKNATTDPAEIRALDSIFQQWQTQAVDSWNISGEPCSGVALSNDESVRVYGLDKRGEMPKELLDLSFLTFLKIDRNFFSGPLPPFIGNMSKLELLSITFNDFSGPIPKELGNLKELRLLGLAVNNFSGTLPPELGKLVNLEQLDIASCGLGGDIPLTFANLENLQKVRASDNAFTGKIPDFVGNNWTKLTSLRFEGNSFEGPIPSSLANLASLTFLRIGDIYHGSSSLDFVGNLKNLTELILRNVLLTGILPSYITELHSLERLDLSFNNLTGTIPSDMFMMGSLKYLFLGNNGLSGPIPNRTREILITIDLSYNFLSGNLPSWVNSVLELNLVGNNFTINSSNIRLLPGLECLQRSFPCSRDAPRYATFSIKCGGPEMISKGIVFEADNRTVGAAVYDITTTQKWAISNVGVHSGVQNTLAQVRSTDSPELYNSSRLSPGSLRYYGLGLENGAYTVKLFFAETSFPDRSSQSWKSLARRVFDVYIQGTRQLRDFDISKDAGGVDRAIIKNFTADVTGNHLEIHLFWAGKGTCCTPKEGLYGPSISAISVVPNFVPTVGVIPPATPKEKNQASLIVGITVSVVVLALIIISVVIYKKGEQEDEEEEAVKQLSVASNQGNEQFVTEITTISAVRHRNLVKLYGCCIGGNRRLLVYEYLENKSLDQALFGKNDLHLDWPSRFNICLSTARGLAYLHEDSRPKIVHRDVKASNILLDAELFPKISDFGLAKHYDDKKTHITTRAAGTIGYLAPEYAMRGHLTEKVDVFGFGVVALEIISGRPNSYYSLENERIYLLEWVWTLHENNQLLSLVDPTLVEFDENEALRTIGVALLCTQASPSMRPSMSRVVGMLGGDFEVKNVTTKPSYLTDCDFTDITGSLKNEKLQTSLGSSCQEMNFK
ncbi:hypothetical protein V6N11_064037 [Hibiscus sabdariffa]|uniref:non-specific serine/threonine protein kinase n=1 Tax=Hibiscus sabdariffa TaxID=183260 RepID=A0ABR2PMG7_9ROSI